MEAVSSEKNLTAKSEMKNKSNNFFTILKKIFDPRAMAVWIPIAIIAKAFFVCYCINNPSKVTVITILKRKETKSNGKCKFSKKSGCKIRGEKQAE